MDKINANAIIVDVKNGLYGYENRYDATACRGKLALCHFSKGIDVWNFDAYGIGKSFVKSDEFPIDYFKRLCQAICFISLGLEEFPEIELTARAKKLLHIR